MRLGLARLCLPALALATVAGLLLDSGPAAGQQQGQPAGGGKGVPVTVATAKRQDVPVWLDGIGNVQAYNTVTIRSRVDGEVMKVAFTEGQTVKAGDLLAQIDPRPFQAALDQAKAKKAQDEAQLQNAQRDLARSTDLEQRGFAPRQPLDQQRAQVDQFTAAVQGDDAAIELLEDVGEVGADGRGLDEGSALARVTDGLEPLEDAGEPAPGQPGRDLGGALDHQR